MHKETKLLQTIDRLKINANHENKDLRVQHTLTSMGKPKKFELKNGKTVRRGSGVMLRCWRADSTAQQRSQKAQLKGTS